MKIDTYENTYNGTHSLYNLIKLGRNRYTIELRIYEEITEEDVFEFMTEIAALFKEHKKIPYYYHYLRFANIDITVNNKENKVYKKENFKHIIDVLKGDNLGIYVTTNKEWETIHQD